MLRHRFRDKDLEFMEISNGLSKSPDSGGIRLVEIDSWLDNK
jgi:hypothetical protein